MDAVTVIITIAGLIKTSAKVAQVTLGFLSDIVAYPDEMNKLITSVRSMHGFLCSAEPVIARLEAQKTGFGDMIITLEQRRACMRTLLAIMDFLNNSLQHRNNKVRGAVERVVWAVGKKDEAKLLLEELERHKSALDLAFSAQLFAESVVEFEEASLERKTAAKERLDLQTERKAEKRKHVLDWLSSFDHKTKHTYIKSKRVENSARWFFQDAHFRAWMTGRNGASQNTLYCPGSAGVGKSFLTSSVIDYLQDHFTKQNVAVAYIYFDYKNHEIQNGRNMAASLLQQLAAQSDYLDPGLEKTYDELTARRETPDLPCLIQHLTSCVKVFQSAFVIMDALDEAGEEERPHILLILKAMVELGPQCKIMATSRGYLQNVHDLFELSPTIEIKAQPSDIENFLEERLSQKEVKVTPDLKSMIKTELLKNAGGMFLVVEFQLKYILGKKTPRKRKEALQTLPRTLEDLYGDIMMGIDKSEPESKELALKAFSWVWHAKRPLSITELCQAVAVERDFEDIGEGDCPDPLDVIECCRGLLLHEQSSGIVRFAHHTIQPFLETNYSDQLLTTADLAATCLSYLLFDVFEEGPCGKEEAFDARVESYNLASYAAQYWGTYMRGPGEEDFAIRELLFQLMLSIQKRESMREMALKGNRVIPWSHSTLTRGLTALHIFAQNGLASICKSVLELDQDKAVRYVMGEYPKSPDTGISMDDAKTLLDEVRNVDARDGYHKTALHYAASSGHKDVVIALLEKGADIAAQANGGLTSLHYSASSGNKDVVEVLLDNGADVTDEADGGWTALHWAAVRGKQDVVTLLLERGADLKVRASGGWNAVHWAASSGNRDVLMALLERGTDISPDASEACNALHYAVSSGHRDVILGILERGATQPEGNVGNTALHYAASSGHKAVVSVLLDWGADISARANDGGTALHWAASSGNTDIVRILLDRGADVKAQANGGLTALHWAASSGNKEAVKILLERGSDISLAGNDGRTALHYAAWNGDSQVMRLLLPALKASTDEKDILSQETNGSTIELLTAIISTYPRDISFRRSLGNEYLRQKRYEEAKVAFDTSMLVKMRNSNVTQIEDIVTEVCCDDCSKSISGYHYKCLRCGDGWNHDLCGECFRKTGHPHPDLLIIPSELFSIVT